MLIRRTSLAAAVAVATVGLLAAGPALADYAKPPEHLLKVLKAPPPPAPNVAPGGQRLLLTHHRKLQRWLQLGGHADGDRDLAQVALKEAEEESGLSGLVLEDPAIFDLDKHWIPERKDVPGHWHYDVRFVIRALGGEAFVLSDESLDLAWRPVTEVAADPESDESMQRMARRWLAR